MMHYTIERYTIQLSLNTITTKSMHVVIFSTDRCLQTQEQKNLYFTCVYVLGIKGNSLVDVFVCVLTLCSVRCFSQRAAFTSFTSFLVHYY